MIHNNEAPPGLMFLSARLQTIINITVIWICWVPIAEFGTYIKTKDPSLPNSVAYFASSLCYGFTFFNGFVSHTIFPIVGGGWYSPGTLTSVVFFIPISLFVFWRHVYAAFGRQKKLFILWFPVYGAFIGHGVGFVSILMLTMSGVIEKTTAALLITTMGYAPIYIQIMLKKWLLEATGKTTKVN